MRYNAETLEVRFKGKSIYDVLESSVDECRELFQAFPLLSRVLEHARRSRPRVHEARAAGDRRSAGARRSA